MDLWLKGVDGSFQVDSVPAGDYTLTMRAYPAGSSPYGPYGMPGGSGATKSVPVAVPENPDPTSFIDIGEIVMTVPKKNP